MFGFDKTKVTNGKLYGELRPVLKYNFKEQDWLFRLHVESADLILYILGHTDNGKDRLQHLEKQSWLALTQFQR